MVVMDKNKRTRITRHRSRSREVHISSIVNEVIKGNSKPLQSFLRENVTFTKSKKIHTSEKEKKKKKNSMRIKIYKRKKVTSLKLPLITSFIILLQNEELKYSCHTSSRLREEIILN